jgi:hypothetical protein
MSGGARRGSFGPGFVSSLASGWTGLLHRLLGLVGRCRLRLRRGLRSAVDFLCRLVLPPNNRRLLGLPPRARVYFPSRAQEVVCAKSAEM